MWMSQKLSKIDISRKLSKIEIRDFRFRFRSKFYANMPRPLYRPQAAQNFNWNVLVLQYLSIDPKKGCHAHSNAHNFPRPL